MKPCPECRSEIHDDALVCPACGRRVVGKPCPRCAELARQEALKCPHCGHDFARAERVISFEPYATKAALLPTLLLRGRLIPQEIQLSPEKILIRTWGLFWLRHVDEEIPWEKIAGYHYNSGIFWDGVEIQTRGQKANHIGCLDKSRGQRIKEVLELMKE